MPTDAVCVCVSGCVCVCLCVSSLGKISHDICHLENIFLLLAPAAKYAMWGIPRFVFNSISLRNTVAYQLVTS